MLNFIKLFFAIFSVALICSCEKGEVSQYSHGDSESTTTIIDGAGIDAGIDITTGEKNELALAPEQIANLPAVLANGRQFADANVVVNLSGTVVAKNNATISSVSWVQTKGVAVEMLAPSELNNLFITPDVREPTLLVFKLVVQDSTGLTNAATVPVTVAPQQAFVRVLGGVVNEDDGVATFIVKLNNVAAEPVVVNYFTQSDTATEGLDYTGASGELVFAPGEIENVVDVDLIADSEEEPFESFSLRISATSGAVNATNSASVVIRNSTASTEPTLEPSPEPLDSDSDGYTDEQENAVESDPNNPLSTPLDFDGDGVANSDDAFPRDPTETQDTDGDGIGDNADTTPNGALAWVSKPSTYFQPHELLVEFSEVLQILPLDVDGDGDQDLICICNSGKNISWIENIEGYFSALHPIMRYENSRTVSSITLGDIDGDGDSDILMTKMESGAEPTTFAWLENVGNTVFSERTLAAIDEANTIKADDVNGDGLVDILVGNWSSLDLTIFENQGGLIFNKNGIGAEDVMVTSIATYPAGNSSNKNIAVTSAGTIVTYEYSAEGYFQTFIIDGIDIGATQVEVADMDNNGSIDFIANLSGESVGLGIIEDGGEGYWISRSIDTNGFPGMFSIADQNDDGYLDIVASMGWVQNSGGTELIFFGFDAGFGVSDETASNSDLPIANLEIDSGSSIDVVTVNGAEVNHYLSNQAGSLTSYTMNFGFFEDYVGPVSVGDMDQDGDVDIYSMGLWFEQVAPFQFVTRASGIEGWLSSEYSLYCYQYSYWPCELFDIDNDSDLDLVLQSRIETGWVISLNNGKGFFEESARVDFDVAGHGDFDQDGDIDLISLISGDKRGLFVQENLGNQVYTTHVLYESLDATESLSLVDTLDYNEDGLLDIVTNNFSALNQGGMLFEISNYNSDPVGIPGPSAIGDLDGDNDIDIVGLDWTSLVWRENIEGSFAPAELLPALGSDAYPSKIALDDLDGDGDQDILLTSSYFSVKGYWVENLGGNNFVRHYLWGDLWGDYGYDLSLDFNATDLNADGTQEIVGTGACLYGCVNGGVVWFDQAESDFSKFDIPYFEGDTNVAVIGAQAGVGNIQYSLIGANFGSVVFGVESATGAIFLEQNLGGDLGGASFEFVLQATDGVSTIERNIIVEYFRVFLSEN